MKKLIIAAIVFTMLFSLGACVRSEASLPQNLQDESVTPWARINEPSAEGVPAVESGTDLLNLNQLKSAKQDTFTVGDYYRTLGTAVGYYEKYGKIQFDDTVIECTEKPDSADYYTDINGIAMVLAMKMLPENMYFLYDEKDYFTAEELASRSMPSLGYKMIIAENLEKGDFSSAKELYDYWRTESGSKGFDAGKCGYFSFSILKFAGPDQSAPYYCMGSTFYCGAIGDGSTLSLYLDEAHSIMSIDSYSKSNGSRNTCIVGNPGDAAKPYRYAVLSCADGTLTDIDE